MLRRLVGSKKRTPLSISTLLPSKIERERHVIESVGFEGGKNLRIFGSEGGKIMGTLS